MKGKQILNRLDDGLQAAAAKLAGLTRQAVASLTPDRLLTAQKLFTDEQLAELAKTFAGVWATGELLGRAVPRVRLNRLAKFADPRPFPEMQVLSPREALSYFTALVPGLGVDHRTYEDQLERDVFTMAAATSMDVLYRVRDVIIRGMMEGEPAGAQSIRQILIQAGIHPENNQYCYLPGTLVEGAVEVASQARYNGPAIEIETNDGRRLRVTANHPILTATGWKAAGVVQEGEQLVCYGGPVESLYGSARFPKGRAINNKNRPASVEDVFQTIIEKGTAFSDGNRPVGALDFHGDAAFFEGDINRVRAYRALQYVSQPHGIELGRKIGFMERNISPPVPACHRCGLLGARRHGSFNSYSGSVERPEYGGLLGGRHIGPSGAVNIGTASNIDPRLYHKGKEAARGNSQLYGKLVTAFPGLVSLNSVVKVKRFRWAGHVYDLQTSTGYIVSQGIITSNCEMVYRTNVMDAYAAGHDREMADPEMQEYFPAWLYSATIDQNSRPDHAKKNDRMYSQRVPFVLVRGTTAAEVCNCVLPGMYAGGHIQAALKARYSGPACEVITARGLRLRLTVNHPVLTRRGWIAAGKLNKGDDLAGHAHKVNGLVARGDIQNTPAKIEKIFAAFSMGVNTIRVIDLYGDERFIDGNINVVSANRFLQLDRIIQVGKAFCDSQFILAYLTKAYHSRRGALGAAFKRVMLSTSGRVSSGGLLLSGGGVHSGPLQGFSGGLPTQSDAAFNKNATNNIPADAARLGDSVLADSPVFFDNVSKVRYFDYTGHVYDLQSTTGVFAVGNDTDSGIVIKNCRCTPIDLDKWEVANRIAAGQVIYTGVI